MGKSPRFHGVMTLERAKQEAQQLGIDVSYGNGGEAIFRFGKDVIRHNNRRKDASRALLKLLRRAAEVQSA